MRVFNETRYGRLYAPDHRDMLYPMKVNKLAAAMVLEKHWRTGHTLDQGPHPYCVGYAGRHFLEAAPIMARKGRVIPDPVAMYKEAQKRDEWPGENYDGTSGRGLMKFLREIGVISEYLWAPNIETLKNYLLTRGPVLVGSEWFSGMSSPMDIKGSAYLDIHGVYEGGHEYLFVGYSRKRHAFRMLNSWGVGWGEGGRAWIDYENANALIFMMNGDAVSAIEAP